MAEILNNDVTENGLLQGDLVKVLKNLRDVVNELQTDHATTKAALDLLIHRSKNYVLGATDPVLAIDTNFDVKNTETIVFVAEGVKYTLGDNTSFNTGTTKTLGASKWGAAMLEAITASTGSLQWAAGEYASEALALAAAKALTPTASKCPIGFVTVEAHASGFTAGTDALTTGTGGNVANATNYYSLASPLFAAGPATLTNSTAITLSKG
jgi:hypothetical protein